MSGLPRLLWWRLRTAAAWPPTQEWLYAGGVLAIFVAVAVPLAAPVGLIDLALLASLESLAWSMPLRILLLPALLEELIFRVLANPNPAEKARPTEIWGSAVLSLSAYVLLHPLVGLLNPGHTSFALPLFLLLFLLLGAACLLLYRRSGSIWPPVALHSFVVATWLALGGQGLVPSS